MKRLLLSFFILQLIPVFAFSSNSEEQEKSIKNPDLIHFSYFPESERQNIYSVLRDKIRLIPEKNIMIQWMVPHVYGNNDGIDYSTGPLKYPSLKLIQSSVSQCTGGNKYLIHNNSDMIEMSGNTVYVDGSIIQCFALEAGTFDYTTVLGANRRIRKYKEVPSVEVDFEKFTESLKEGESYLIIAPIQKKCPTCRGNRYIKSLKGRLGGDPCPSCRKTGVTSIKVCKKLVY